MNSKYNVWKLKNTRIIKIIIPFLYKLSKKDSKK